MTRCTGVTVVSALGELVCGHVRDDGTPLVSLTLIGSLIGVRAERLASGIAKLPPHLAEGVVPFARAVDGAAMSGVTVEWLAIVAALEDVPQGLCELVAATRAAA